MILVRRSPLFHGHKLHPQFQSAISNWQSCIIMNIRWEGWEDQSKTITVNVNKRYIYILCSVRVVSVFIFVTHLTVNLIREEDVAHTSLYPLQCLAFLNACVQQVITELNFTKNEHSASGTWGHAVHEVNWKNSLGANAFMYFLCYKDHKRLLNLYHL